MMLPEDHSYQKLIQLLASYPKLAVAFSGGTDSSFLLAAAREALGERLIAYTIKTSYISQRELEEALSFTARYGIRHRVIELDFPEIIRQNPPDRCYLCKKNIFTTLLREALADGFSHLCDGTNADDTGVYRPGMQALRELNILSPLLAAGLNKDEIRRLSTLLGLPTSAKPALACLLTRIPYHTEIKTEDLLMIEKAETFLHGLGYHDVRVRTHGKLARIETSREHLPQLLDPSISEKITTRLKDFGYTFVTLDLEGYRTGAMDVGLKKD